MRTVGAIFFLAGLARGQGPDHLATTICLLEARDLVMLPRDHPSPVPDEVADPSAVLEIGGRVCRLPTVHDTDDPSWEACCYFGFQSRHSLLSLRVVDSDAFVDANYGSLTMPLDVSRELWLPLHFHGQVAGRVHLRAVLEARRAHPPLLDGIRVRSARSGFLGAELALEPAFRPEIREYAVQVHGEDDGLVIAPELRPLCSRPGATNCPRAAASVVPPAETSAGLEAAPVHALDGSRTTFHVVVTPPNSQVTTTYAVHAHRAGASDATLARLSIENVRFSRPFSPEVLDYRATVPASEAAVVVHAQAASAFARVNGLQIGAAGGHNTWRLHPGTNLCRLVITSEDGRAHRAYHIALERAPEKRVVNGAGDVFHVEVPPGSPGAVVAPLSANPVHVRNASVTHPWDAVALVSRDTTSVRLVPGPALRAAGAVQDVNGMPVEAFARKDWRLQPGTNLLQVAVRGADNQTQAILLAVIRGEASRGAPTIATGMPYAGPVQIAGGAADSYTASGAPFDPPGELPAPVEADPSAHAAAPPEPELTYPVPAVHMVLVLAAIAAAAALHLRDGMRHAARLLKGFTLKAAGSHDPNSGLGLQPVGSMESGAAAKWSETQPESRKAKPRALSSDVELGSGML